MTSFENNQLIDLFNAGRYEELESRARLLLVQYPESGFVWKVLSVSLQMQGKDALCALQKTTALLPNDAEAHSNLGNALRNSGQFDEAMASYRLAVGLKPDFAEAYNNLGNIIQIRSCGDAMACFCQALEIKPDYAEAHYNLGNAMYDLGQVGHATVCYRRALLLQPDFLEAGNNLGIALQKLGQLDDALDCFRHVAHLNPDYPDTHYNLGNILQEQGRGAEAENHYRQALAHNLNDAKTHNNLGNLLKDQGRLEEACLSYETAIANQPDLLESHYSLALLKTFGSDEPHLGILEQLSSGLEALPMETQIRYWFTLGKMREDVERYDDSFDAYRKGNQLQHALIRWDDTAEAALAKRIMSIFSTEFFSERPRPQRSDKTPTNKTSIFIVGMPRSGTSLLEQIMSSYPGIHGAGELSDMSEVVTNAMPGAAFAQFPEAVLGLSANDFRRLGEQYIEKIWKRAPEARHMVDKMPVNFFYLGMIRQMLPNAKIIHAMRDPMDSCFSCYSRLFSEQNQGFSYDMDTLGRYYARYVTLMRHWHAVFPSGTILDMRYEDLVDDTEAQTRRLLTYLELPWDSRCLAFHQNKRRVETASAAQVRRPIYRSSVARWERYAKHLSPLFELVKNYRD